MSSLNEVDSLSLVSADSLVGAAAADDDDDGEDRRHPLRRIFSSLLHRDIGTSNLVAVYEALFPNIKKSWRCL